MSRVVGMRVVRGPHWQGQNQDGGEGGLGTVVATASVSAATTRAVVLWDCGTKANYRIGENSAYDLRIIDNAACGIRHQSVACNACKSKEIVGIRWKCKVCTSYNLCTACYMADQHDVTHAFLRVTEPSLTASVVSQRKSSTKLESKGIVPGAIVTRSSDWKWGDQDGGRGQTGVVTEICNWPGNCNRDAVRVNWSATQHSDLYRFGYEGKVDVVATSLHPAGKYYPQHLPNLGEPDKKPTTPFPAVPNRMPFAIGDKVRVNVPAQVLANMQEGHGGWLPEMRYVVEKVGVVRAFTELGNVQVEFDSNTKYVLNPAALTKFVKASVGDIVKIIRNAKLAQELQSGRGEWSDTMAEALGRIGKVISYTPNGDLRVHMGQTIISWNPECCTEPSNADKESYEAAVSVAKPPPSDGASVKQLAEKFGGISVKEKFKVGDTVTIMNDAAKVVLLQKGHGEWIDEMAQALGKTGKVVEITAEGNLQVLVRGHKWWFNPDCCSKAAPQSGDDNEGDDEDGDGGDPGRVLATKLVGGLVAAQLQIGMLRALSQAAPRFKAGDIVKVDHDVTRVKLRQIGHGGWNDMMLLTLGKAGRVIAVDSDGDVQVNTGLMNWTFNPASLEPITAAEAGECLIC